MTDPRQRQTRGRRSRGPDDKLSRASSGNPHASPPPGKKRKRKTRKEERKKERKKRKKRKTLGELLRPPVSHTYIHTYIIHTCIHGLRRSVAGLSSAATGQPDLSLAPAGSRPASPLRCPLVVPEQSGVEQIHTSCIEHISIYPPPTVSVSGSVQGDVACRMSYVVSHRGVSVGRARGRGGHTGVWVSRSCRLWICHACTHADDTEEGYRFSSMGWGAMRVRCDGVGSLMQPLVWRLLLGARHSTALR